MRIAIATDEGQVAQHFGRCPEYTIFDVNDDDEIVSKNIVKNPGHEPGFLPRFMSEEGVSVVIAGGMGPRAEQLFASEGIEIVTGVVGEVDQVCKDFLNNNLQSNGSFCEENM